MKKVALFLGVAFLASMTLTSCKKDYVCECTYDMLGTTQTYKFDIKDAKKKDAEEACEYTLPGFTGTVTCELQ